MHIYIEGGKKNEFRLKEISNGLYGRRYAWLGGDRFYFGYTVISTSVERPYCEVTFENEHPHKQMAFIETLARQFTILRVEAEDLDEEGETVAKWAESHEQQPLPKKIELPIVMIRMPYDAKTQGIYGKPYKYVTKDRTERLYITKKYNPEGLADAKRRFHMVSLEEYEQIRELFDAPEDPSDAFDE